ncbi:hypothetical protein K501DRAFT_259803 [Backusella circina FSU 941]|nr:hypothetical protein K501DRAFT_259803 [Backusella circina FSU 941]
MSTEETFHSFEKYDFENDNQFKAGVASLLNNKQDNESDLLEKAKLFYYSKFVTPVDADAYKQWKEDKKEQKEEVKTEGEEEEEEEEKKDDKPPRFTFQELVDMIEKGVEIPGIRQIPNKLNEGTPSESKMTARPKPWELNKE